MLTHLPKPARDVLATAVHDVGIGRLLEIAILRLLEIGEDFAIADELAVPFYGGVIHSRRCYFLLSRQAYMRFPTESDECFLVNTEHTKYIGVRNSENTRSFRASVVNAPAIGKVWIYDVPVLPLSVLCERLLRDEFAYAMAAVVTLIRRQNLDETFTEQLTDAVHPAYLDCLNEVRQEAAYERG